jgi:hypothetical protein
MGLNGGYNWFVQGFDTADLKDAKVPLDLRIAAKPTAELTACNLPPFFNQYAALRAPHSLSWCP